MAKLSMIKKNEKRKQLSDKWGPKRAELRRKAVDPKLSDEEKDAARLKLQKLPRDTSPTRVVTRCHLTGRPRAVYRKFMLSRLAFRELAHKGLLPGVTKSSW